MSPDQNQNPRGAARQDPRVLQLSTVHPWDDNRICRKICASLAEAGYDVVLMAREANSDASVVPEGVELHVLPNPRNRIFRGLMSLGVWKRARRLRPDIIHFHDPELIPAALLLRFMGYKTIYDVHEDYPEKIKTKTWLPAPLRLICSIGMKILESLGSACFSSTFVVTDHLQERFSNGKTRLLRNYPLRSETLPVHLDKPAPLPRPLIYVGGLDAERGLVEMLKGFEAANTPCRSLELLGTTPDPAMNLHLDSASKSDRIVVHGWCTREVVKNRLTNALAGLVLLQATETYVESLPTKMFEYMAAGVPVIASDFPLWRRIIETHGCGILVDQSSPADVGAAIDWMYENPEDARKMGENGRRAIRDQLNWESESTKLHQVYAGILASL